MSQTRRLAAILAVADVAGYSRLMRADGKARSNAAKRLRRELVDPKIAEHHGRIVKIQTPSTLHQRSALADAPASASPSRRGAGKSP